jgi:hypothetical protein
VAGSEQDTASGLPLPDDVTGSWCAQDAIVSDDQLLDAICRANLRNNLCDFRIPVSSITTDDQCATFSTFWNREDDSCNKVL